ncbi:MAG: hypothetical protein GVY13_18255 [Alphaproteobacteria bacterium]|jgi:nitrogen fixation protein FixH|nr:hypothetical protein [Alphaproteobacteria bacterium]
MTDPVTARLTKPFRGDSWIPWAFVGFFLVVVLVNGIMIWVAFSTWTGISGENANSYRQGLAFNERLAAVRAQEALGWQVDVAFESGTAGAHSGRLAVDLSGADGASLAGAQVTAELLRPTHPGHDFAVPLLSSGNAGTYGAEIDFPLAGQWDLRVTATHPDGTYRLTDRLFVR